MQGLSEQQLLCGLLALAVILGCARGGGEVARRLDQPEVLGQFVAGFLLGPSVLAPLLPAVYHTLFFTPGVDLVLSGFSWVGAILLLLIAGLEVDLQLLRAEARPAILAAALAIVPSLAAGTLFTRLVLGNVRPYGFGIVLSVTAVSVAAAILIEREAMRRRYAQVILAAGVASEVMVWLMLSVVASLHGVSPVLTGARSAAYALLFFVFMLTVGRRFTFWAMRRVADTARIARGQLTLVLVLTFLSAALTQALGLHALLGAFVFGVLLSRAPRARLPLLESVQTMTLGFFGPIFFVLAGMRVNIFLLHGAAALWVIALLFVVATAVKVGCSMLGARLGGLNGWEAALVGFGLNLKGGTDVVVAIIATELGLLSGRAYTIYAVVAILTVVVSPPILAILARRAAPSEAETARLRNEEAEERAYLTGIERVFIPVAPQLAPSLAARVVERLAVAKHRQGRIFDITEFVGGQAVEPERASDAVQARNTLRAVGRLRQVAVTRRHATRRAMREIFDAAKDHDLIAIGAQPPERHSTLSFGRLQDLIVQQAETDILIVTGTGDPFAAPAPRRILVPTNGQEYSMAAGDIAAHLAQSYDAELVILTVVHDEMAELSWRRRERNIPTAAASGMVRELAFRSQRLGVRTSEHVRIGADPGREILNELSREPYGLVVLGAIDRGVHGWPYLGRSIQNVLTQGQTPSVVLISRDQPLPARARSA